MNTYIALVRHGATDWNYDARAQGHSDIPLNQEGRRQAEAVASRMAIDNWDAIYSSDLNRAHATAQAIARRTGITITLAPTLRERNIGLAEGTIESERELRWPGVPWNSLPGLETNEQLATRAKDALTEIARRHRGQRIIVVTHGGLIAAFIRLVRSETGAGNPSLYAEVPRNTGITPVVFDGQVFSPAGPQEFSHLLFDGVEYSGEKYRLLHDIAQSGLPGVRLAPKDAESLIVNATAVESAWVDGRLVGYVRAFTDRVRYGYIDLFHTLSEHPGVGPAMLKRLEDRFPGVRFTILGESFEERSGA